MKAAHPSRTLDTRVLVLVGGNELSASGERARLLLSELSGDVAISYRSTQKLRSMTGFILMGLKDRPGTVYVLDTVWATVVAGLTLKLLTGCRMVLDTGDAAYALARSTGRLSPLGLLALWLMERAAIRAADTVVVRGRYHRLYLRDRGIKQVIHVPDCVLPPPLNNDLDRESAALRRELGLEGLLTVGLVGSSRRSRKLGISYGWDLIEALALLPDISVHGIIIGDGDGIPQLQRRIEELDLRSRITLLGRIDPPLIHRYVRTIDICLSTQTDDLVGWVRTTGKLPLYLINDRFVLATDVGEASWVLPTAMRLTYSGVVDPHYPRRLAARIREIALNPAELRLGRNGHRIVRKHFDTRLLRERVRVALKKSEPSEGAEPPVERLWLREPAPTRHS